MAKCAVTAYEKNSTYAYTFEGDAYTHTLVPTVMTVRITDIPATQKVIPIARCALPFGLLDRIVVRANDPEQLLPPCAITVLKSTGARTFASEAFAQCLEAHCAREELSVDADAQDADMKLVKDTTGHNMAFRMIAAASVVNIDMSFSVPPPDTLIVSFHGANAVPKDTDFNVPKPKLLFPALTPQKRIALHSTTAAKTAVSN